MTTTTQEPTQLDAVEVYRSIGRLEGEQAQMNERLGSIETRLDRVESKLDRLIFMLFGIGATFAIAQVAILVRLFLG